MDNYALNVINEHVENEGFTVDSDSKAEWVLSKIREEQADANRQVMVCRTMANEYQMKAEQIQKQLEQKTAYLKGCLSQYFETVPKKSTKTQETYKLPSGTLKRKYLEPEFKKDDEALVKWLKDNGLSEYVKTKDSPDWATLKKTIKVSGEKVITENGEIIEGITAIERDPVFEVEV